MRQVLMLVAFGVMLLALAGCGSKKSNSAQSGSGASVQLAGSKLGQILVDAQGRTLYLFEADKNGKSACTGSCAGTWPPFTAASPSAGNGLDGGALATTARADGTQQVTYHGHPLYYYAGDETSAGSTKGEGLDTFGGAWYVVDGTGKAVQPGSGGDMSGGGYGY
jgi:predicted lipoprotein with Yx(FWY)xxD motif